MNKLIAVLFIRPRGSQVVIRRSYCEPTYPSRWNRVSNYDAQVKWSMRYLAEISKNTWKIKANEINNLIRGAPGGSRRIGKRSQMKLNKLLQTKIIHCYFYWCVDNSKEITIESLMAPQSSRRRYPNAPYYDYHADRLHALTSFIDSLEKQP